MMNSMKNQCKAAPGTLIEGKWHKNCYTLIKELGYGANGVVYLVRRNHQYAALKMSSNGASITLEVNVLKSFAKVQASALGPSLLDVDDWVTKSGNIPFYVMEYIQGPDLLTFIEQKGHAWLPVLMLQLLNDLEKLHQSGWVFGDLKPENIIVTGPPVQVRCIDVGGTTLRGRAIKEFTEFYDRGYWGLGSRKADPGYDLFAVAMIMMNTVYPKRFNKSEGGLSQLTWMVKQKDVLKGYEKIILHAFQGHYQSAAQMRRELLAAVNKEQPAARSVVQQSRTTKKVSAKRQQHKRKKGGIMETVIIFLIVISFYVIYMFGQLI
ncbi:serine/threonine-protein kinase [Bacillus benzoevorans]|uniref:Serine/threonine-protein kinase n=2 Tax=Bacillus benzoevorans TaxID=1456 RepID=A0A7X0HV75_9BACI|nr:serine/threonine-protein kinase [Bacillus benzoevorans]